MALAGTTIWEVQTGGSDANNGGAFDPGQTAGMFTDGAATSATGNSPVFSSASYNFVAGDVGAWVFIGAGTNWTKGWYKISSVASNKATLDATIGAAVGNTAPTATTAQFIPNTVAGCATTASPTGATWSIDYSQQAAAQFTYTDLASVGAGLTVSSAANPFAKQHVGNCLVITGGTNFTAGRYVIASVAVGVATVVGAANMTTGAGVSGTGGQGGALASLGQVGAHFVAQNQVFIKAGTYTVTSASTNVAAGCFAPGSVNHGIEGYATVRGDLTPLTAAGTRPTIIASGISTFTFITAASAGVVRSLIVDGASLTSSKGISTNGSVIRCHGQNFTNGAISGNASAVFCSATGCASVAPFNTGVSCLGCVAYSNTITGFSGPMCINCVSYSNSGASSDGFAPAGFLVIANCTAYGNGRDGVRLASTDCVVVNCVAESNTGVGFGGVAVGVGAINCATYNNTGGATSFTGVRSFIQGMIPYTASAFTNAAGGDFSLNTTAGGGAALRGAGYLGLFPGGLTTGYIDVGAVQHADPAGGGVMFHPGMSGGMAS